MVHTAMDGGKARCLDSFEQRWPPDQFPSLHFSPPEAAAVRRRQRLARVRERLLQLLEDDIGRIAAQVCQPLSVQEGGKP
jgi:hypothetical protein